MTYIVLVGLLILSACFSGLNLGMMSLTPHDLKRKMEIGDKRAQKIYSVRKKGNLLLVTLLLGNVAVNAVIAIFMGSIASGLVAGIIATLLITVFGEIFPQAVFSRFALQVGSKVVWLVKIFIFILYSIAAPFAYLLNKTLGEELPTVYSRHELSKIIAEHSENECSDIERHESEIIKGALSFSNKIVREAMTPKSSVISLGVDDILDKKTLLFVGKHGYPRIPVLNKETQEVKGIIYTYDLLNLKNLNKKASDVCHKKICYVKESAELDHVLKALIKNRQHLFVVINEFKEFSGIITVEDIVEDILGKEIEDEFDNFFKKSKKRRRKKVTKNIGKS